VKTTYAPFDAAQYLDDDVVVAEYLTAAAEDPNPDVFLAALGDVAKARGMAEIAKRAGLGRESLYKALGAGAHPRYETVSAVLRALGVKLTVAVDSSKPMTGLRESRTAFDSSSSRRRGKRLVPSKAKHVNK
jgi:probable addiction module antidote protein